MFERENLKKSILKILKMRYGKNLENALLHEKYYSISKAIMEFIIDNWQESNKIYEKGKMAYYFSSEFLIGRVFGNNLINLGIYDELEDVLNDLEIDINEIEKSEEDAGLGNGGLGRLAACFLDSSATLNLPVMGYGIRYEYGIFKQKFINGFQIEEADNWLKNGNPWSIRREEDSQIIEFSDSKVRAVPYDIPIIGYKTKNINTLRLWKSEPIKEFDYSLFNEQKYDEAVYEKNRAENISRVLYPNDSKDEGKILRLKQQYLLASASLQDIIKGFKKEHSDFTKFPKFIAIQLNDTHPVVSIPELIRLLMDKEGLNFNKAWDITVKTFSYTNHTILAEALETWRVSLFKRLLPRIYEIIKRIDSELVKNLKNKGYSDELINSMKISSKGLINMAFIAIYGSNTTNGVAELHTNLLKKQELKNWYKLYPERFQNKTNGISPRRWIGLCNKELSNLITELLETETWIKDLTKLKKLECYINNEKILKRFLRIKELKKKQLADYIKEVEGIEINTNSIFYIHIKRLHEYKRQLLNAFYILDLYFRLKENKNKDVLAKTFIFGAKAAPGYYRAKGIIKFINEIASLINNDEDVNKKIKVVFVENYRVSYAEKLFPAADISEQISTAGKEASGTGNMKFMLNGTPTLGTYDGANIEIVEKAGENNNFIFGAKVEEIEKLKRNNNYDPNEYYSKVKGLKRVVDTLIDGTFDDGNTGLFKELYDSLLKGTSWHKPDHYFILKDFNDYRKANNKINKAYKDRIKWAKKCWINMANSGKFSSDRTIKEYAKDIWNIDSKGL
ncbi:MAG: glycogen/starch/alpha-glucan phosphorylase [Firmicutes bacterium]|nr:glycogen/starch/alpha-glucan phosphorylase [Bacillota bacterium]